MELSLPHTLHIFNIFREYDGKENCAEVLEEECIKMFGTKSLNDEHDCNVVSMNSLNIHDANDMQSHKLGEAMFDEYAMFSPPSFDENIYYDESMPPIYDDYIDESGFGRVSTLGSNYPTILEGVESYCDNYKSGFREVMTLVNVNPTILEECQHCILVDHEKNALGAGYIVEFIHDATENYYEGGTYACRNCNNIKFPLYVLKVLKLCLFCLPMLVDYCSHKLFAHKIPMHRKWVRLKCASHILHDALFMFQFLSFM